VFVCYINVLNSPTLLEPLLYTAEFFKMASIALEATLEPLPARSKGAVNVEEIEKERSTSSTSSTDNLESRTVEDEWVYPHPTTFKLTEETIDAVKELSVAVIGAGLSGMSHCFRHSYACIDLTR
jgi:hypothetical protein